MKRLFTSESVTSGHPDKLCDQVSDAVLDAVLKQDPNGRVACETFAPNDKEIIVGGEITTIAKINIEEIVRQVTKNIGYTKPEYGFDANGANIQNLVKEQSPDISQGVTATATKEQGAGDQGHMFGFAISESEQYMPLAITLAHALSKRLEQVRKEKIISYLRPDGKTQVTLEYDAQGKPTKIHTIVVSAQHDDGIDHGQISQDIKRHVIEPVLGDKLTKETIFHINPTGKFVIGGPQGDAGLTGRKIIMDTYGGGSLMYGGRHGGGAFSGKDPSKVDRSAAYMARYIAKNIVAAGIAYACEVQLAYAIGVAQPVSVMVNTFGTGKGHSDADLAAIVAEKFPLKPAEIIKYFDLKRPIYLPTASYGHFGRPEFPWEKIDKAVSLI